jgi:probable HAF family extracellular repeat protein
MKPTQTYTGLVILVSAIMLAGTAGAAPMYSLTDLGHFGGGTSFAVAINDAGLITGYSDTETARHAFVWDPVSRQMTDIGFLGTGDYSVGVDINGSGIVAGYSSPFSEDHAFVWDPATGTMTDLGALGTGLDSHADGINASGFVTGYSHNGDTLPGGGRVYRAFLWDPVTEEMTDIGTLGTGLYSNGASINDSGQVAGHSDNGTERHAFVWDPATNEMTDLGTLEGGDDSYSHEINALGQVVGTSNTYSDYHGFLWDPATEEMMDLGCLGTGDYSVAMDINDYGLVAGMSYTGSDYHAFIWDSVDGMQDLNDLLDASGEGWTLYQARQLNNDGWIVGAGLYEGQERAFLLTPDTAPIPEPATITLMLSLGAGLAASRRVRRRKKD